LRALADRTRRDILRRCAASEPSVSRLAHAYPMSFAAVQKHVAVMERAGLVTKERRGREATRTHQPRGGQPPTTGLRQARRYVAWADRTDVGHAGRGGWAGMTVTRRHRSREPDGQRDRPLRRTGRAGAGTLVGPTQAPALVGAAVLPGDVGAARPGPGRRDHVLHDGPGR